MRLRRSTSALLFSFAFLSLARAAEPSSPQTGYILLMKSPKIYSEPSTASKIIETDWPARAIIHVFDHQKADAAATSDTMSGWFLIQPANAKDSEKGWAPGVFLAPPPQALADADPASIGQERVDRWHGLPPSYEPPDLVSVGPRYDKDIDYRMRREAAAALEKLIAAAKADGISLQVISAYRSWDRQQINYQNRLEKTGWDQNTIARPGHSEHQLGTAVDLTDGDEKTLLESTFGATPAGRWLRDNAPKFGFAQSYSKHNQPETGYAPEPWHFRYWGKDLAPAKHAEALGATP